MTTRPAKNPPVIVFFQRILETLFLKNLYIILKKHLTQVFF